MIVRQVWRGLFKDIRAIAGWARTFYESSTVISEATMWQILESMKDENGCVPLIVERPKEWWKTKEMRGKTYSLVPFAEIEWIGSQEFEDNERIFLSDHIRGTTCEQ